MQHARHARAQVGATLRREEGFGLVEVLVTAVIVIIVGTAVFAGLDASSRASGRTKYRSVASTLVQRDQERLRSLDVASLNNLRQTTYEDACDEDGKACVKYTIESRTQWVSDRTGVESCTTSDGRGDYLQLISTVSWPDMRGSKPVVSKSVYAPPVGSFGPNEGSLAVKLVGADGTTPMAGVRVRLSGPKNFVDTTNSLGCVVWGYLPAGNGYTISLDHDGYVGTDGKQAVAAQASVIGESLTTRTFLYDTASWAKVTFSATIGTTAYANQRAEQITLVHSAMLPNTRRFPDPASSSALLEITADKLFPFKGTSSGGRYRIFAGGCDAQDPDRYETDKANVPQLPDLVPGQGLGYTLRLPAIESRITVNGSAPVPANAPAYKVIQTTPGCTSSVPPALTLTDTSGANAWRLKDPGRPYGTYIVCAQATVGTRTYREAWPVSLTSIAGARVPSSGVMDIRSSGSGRDTEASCNAPF